MNDKRKRLLTGLLLCFVLVTIGYGIGREVTLHKLGAQRGQVRPASAAGGGDQVVVYYMHRTLRCVTCNTIEKMARETVARDFATELKDGRVEWRVVNMDENEDLAKRYDVASSTVVVVRLADGKDATYKRLDEVWTLMEKPEEFAAYVRDAVRACRDGGPPG